MELSIRSRDSQGVRLIRIEGTLDSSTAESLAEPVRSAIAGSVRWLIVELEGVEYVSSAGWGALIAHSQELRAAGGGIVIAGIPHHLKFSWNALGLGGLIAACDTTDDAFRQVRMLGSPGE